MLWLWGQRVLWAKWVLGMVWVQWEQWGNVGTLATESFRLSVFRGSGCNGSSGRWGCCSGCWILTGEEAHGGCLARCLLLCAMWPCPARPGSARSCLAVLIDPGAFIAHGPRGFSPMRQQRDCFTALITACKSLEPGAQPRPQRGAFPVGSGAPRCGCSRPMEPRH